MKHPEHITSGHIQRFIDSEEITLRRRAYPPGEVAEILRYGAVIGSVIERHDKVSRGGDLLRQKIREAAERNRSFPSGTVILADEMERSKGRFSRFWHAPKGGLWMTLGLANTLLPQSSLLLPMAAGVACCEAIRSYNIEASIKWVNDILVKNRKISGILTETFREPRFGEDYVLIGIGINVNNNRFPVELSESATSMKACLNREISLPEVIVRLLVKLQWNIGLLFYEEAGYLEKNGGVAVNSGESSEKLFYDGHLLLKSYRDLTDIFNRRVMFGFDVQKDPQFEAKIVGLDNSGGLILEMADSSRVVQHGGEIIYLDEKPLT